MLNAALTLFVGAAGFALIAYVMGHQPRGSSRGALAFAQAPYVLLTAWGLIEVLRF